MDSLDPQSRAEVEQFIQNESSKAKIHQAVHDLTAVCWTKCISAPIKDNKLDSTEAKCVKDCVGRWMDTTLQIAKNLGAASQK